MLLSWFGHRILKCPFDIWTYQELIFETKPELIVECGTRYGGGALYLASLFDLRGGPGQVMTIDITAMKHRPVHPRIRYVAGSTLNDWSSPRSGPRRPASGRWSSSTPTTPRRRSPPS